MRVTLFLDVAGKGPEILLKFHDGEIEMSATATNQGTHHGAHDQLSPKIEIRTVDNGAASRWLNQGIQDFRESNIHSLLYGLVFVIAGAITIWYTRSNPIFVMAIVTGFYLVGPPVAAGLYEMSRRLEKGERPSLIHAISVLGRNTRCLLGLTLILGLVMIAWTTVATLLVNVFFGDASGFSSGWNALFSGDQALPFAGILLIGGIILAMIASAVSLTFAPLLDHRQMGTITVLAILALIMFAWVRTMILAINAFVDNPDTLASGWAALISEPQFSTFLIVFLIAGLLFAAFAFAISVIAVPLIIHRRVGVLTAIHASLSAVRKNPLPMFRWAATIAGLIAVGLGLFFVGLAIALPIIGHASWHAYRDLVVAVDEEK